MVSKILIVTRDKYLVGRDIVQFINMMLRISLFQMVKLLHFLDIYHVHNLEKIFIKLLKINFLKEAASINLILKIIIKRMKDK
jgi:hypothetical protein